MRSERGDGRNEQRGGSLLVVPEDALIIVPIRNTVLFPGMILPLTIGREPSILAAQQAVKTDRPVGILLQHDAEVEQPGPQDLCRIGTVANILRYVTLPDNTHVIVCQGLQRFRVSGLLPGYPFPVTHPERIDEPETTDSQIEARMIRVRERALELLQYLPQVSQELVGAVKNITQPGALADLVTGVSDLKLSDRQLVLETVDLTQRLDVVLACLLGRLEVLRLSREVDERTKASIDQRQREYLLREQMKSIQKELGEGDGSNSVEIEALRKAVAEAAMPEEVAAQANKELRRLERMTDASAEYSMVRAYLDWLIELPWREPPADSIEIAEARRILDADHFGLTQVKKRIVEFLAVRKLNPGGHGPILCFVGPPGVGKTSLGQSIARALGRKFVRASLGGCHDEAEIRGHRRTYIGALPGNIIQAIRKAGSRGCVMMLDEIDKLGASFQGDPSAALLEVLDPEQNDSFRDNYLALPFDLSRMLFITTANVLDNIPGPLRDRMEIIQLPGYTQEEKLEIARRYLVGRQMAQNGLHEGQIEFASAALQAIIRDYTREAGVRSLEREIGAVCRRVAVEIAEGTRAGMLVGETDLAGILGAGRYDNEVALRTGLAGVATGLAWTPVGGDILFVEASRTIGDGKLILTGQLGEVMKESAQAALTLVKTHAASLGIEGGSFEKSNVHVHVPAGAIPKDGPSAGVAIFVALASLFVDQPVRNDTAMTGEISLRGLVLPVGGIKDKVLAAMRAGITRVLLPARNRRDLEEVPAEAREKLEFVFLESVEDALANALRDDSAAAAAGERE
ncbi:MAG: Lon protease 2 [Candidatus Accumulibacter sp. BA-94]|uniref:endopeptidase La n=1 Tax=Accumulibacter sp. TaxID=2053492 RepID=UPI00044FA3EC|nr:endopeptidase La [Accumulibacter sp.]EXI92990.1 MAG: Lon protease 2 [Candidatus Accumulibacter sp. BA-94]MBL8392160.1 endopeptidase La [Accumulibacter sp.]HRD90331.1 endopeptidase La [Accumulibacter sp.]